VSGGQHRPLWAHPWIQNPHLCIILCTFTFGGAYAVTWRMNSLLWMKMKRRIIQQLEDEHAGENSLKTSHGM